LDALERAVIRGRYGLDGAPERSLKQLQSDLGVPRTEPRDALGSGLSKLRSQLLCRGRVTGQKRPTSRRRWSQVEVDEHRGVAGRELALVGEPVHQREQGPCGCRA